MTLHIVTHDVPYPSDFGGVFDLFYKIRALHGKGVKIKLHCFTHKRPQQELLNEYCESVNYYPRERNIGRIFSGLPFIVGSRISEALLHNLKLDDHPILLEGIHCTYPLFKGLLHDRKVLVRLHNVEYEYYGQLARLEKNPFKKWYYSRESRLLKEYERKIAESFRLLAVNRKDAETYRRELNAGDIHYLPVFLPYTRISGKPGKGCFCLYHGNLSVNENEAAARWLLDEVFSRTNLPLVIAGKSPSTSLEKAAHRQQHTCLVSDPSEQEMQDLIDKAHIHILPSFNTTGIKLKLLNALANGRHCLVNPAAIEGTGLEECCRVETDAVSFARAVNELYEIPFTEHDISKRERLLMNEFDPDRNAEALMRFL